MNADRPDPLDEAFAALRRMPVPERPPDADLIARMVACTSPVAEPPSLFRRRALMRVTIWSTAAAVVVAVSALLLFTGSASVALADVIEAAKKHKLVKYKLTQADETKDGSSVIPFVQVAHADLRAPRYRLEQRDPASMNGALDSQSVFIRDGVKKVTVHVLAETITAKGKTDPALVKQLKMFEAQGVPRKVVTIGDASGDFTPATAEQNKSVLENIRALEKHKDAVSTKGKLKGKAVLKYRIEERHETTILYVDAVTKLPVRMEHELRDPKILHPTVTKMKYTLTDFEWDPALKGFANLDELFSTTPPKGYKVEDHRKKKEKKDE